jgi:hypothetical protein
MAQRAAKPQVNPVQKFMLVEEVADRLQCSESSTGEKGYTPKTFDGAGGYLHNLDHAAEARFETDTAGSSRCARSTTRFTRRRRGHRSRRSPDTRWTTSWTGFLPRRRTTSTRSTASAEAPR